ncbi:MAG: phosphoribosyltransferase family protein [Candidatus Onthomonas sp.]|nr:phosphoribosyltransferase family protein [Candidatus Onthomonas sp.]
MEQEENRRKPTVRGIWEELLRLVYPPKCVFCGTLLEREEQDACKACLAELPWTDESSAVRTGRAFSRCVSPFFLTGKVHQALVDYKYHQRESYGVCFGRWMGACARRCRSDPFDLVTWVPVSRRRLRERGFDQCRLLAVQVAKVYGMRPVRTLKKWKDVPSLASSEASPAMRRKLVAGVYRVISPETVAGKRILLVDDIITTGSTLEEAAGTLRAAGAAEVCCVTAARTPFHCDDAEM